MGEPAFFRAFLWYAAKAILAVFVVLLCAFAAYSHSASGVLRQLSFYGSLKTDANVAVADGSYDIVFKIYDAPTGGNLLWTGTHTAGNGNAVTITNGFFNALLGSGTGNTLSLDFNSDTYYIGITVGSDSEMTPRERIGAAGYAFNADKVDGYDASGLVRLNATATIATSSASTLFTINQQGTGDILNIQDNGTTVFTVLDGGRVGVGTTSPSHTFSVAGDINISGNFYQNGTLFTGSGGGGSDFATTSINTSLKLSTIISDETGSGALVFDTNATLASTTLTGLTTLQNATTSSFAVSGTSYFAGSVGIGTTSPARALDVDSVVNFPAARLTVNTTITNSTVRGAEIFAKSSGANADGLTPLIRFYVSDPASDALGLGGIGFARNGSNSTGDFVVRTDNAGVDSEQFRITASGNVGIGTTSPLQALSVAGNGVFSGNLSTANLTATGTLSVSGQTTLASSLTGLLYGTSGVVSASTTIGAGSLDSNIIFANEIDTESELEAIMSGLDLVSITASDITSANLATALSDETGYASGALAVFSNAPTLTGTTTVGELLFTHVNPLSYNGSRIFSVRGTNNLFVGTNANYTGSTTGANNAVLGGDALYANTSPTSSVAIGYQAGAGNYQAYSNQGGVYVGESAGYNLSTGSDYNTLLGFASGYNITSGANNIIIGSAVDAPNATGDRQLNIGNLIYGTNLYSGTSNSATPAADGRFGIGSTSPFAKLSIHGNASDSGITLFAIGSSTASATTTLFSVGNTGSTTIAGGLQSTQLTVTGTATSTFANGINLAAGCISVNGQCLAPASNFGTTSIDTSSELAAILTDETGSGALVFGTSPTLASTTLTGLTTLQNATTSSFAVTGTSYFGGNVGVGTTSTALSKLTIGGNVSQSSWGTTGSGLSVPASTITDTTGSGSITARVANSFGIPTFDSSNAVTLTRAATLYIAGAPTTTFGGNTTITNPFALWSVGNNRFDGFSAFGLLNVGQSPSAKVHITGNASDASWTTTGLQLAVANDTLTDTSSPSTTVITTRAASSFAIPTFAFTNSTSTITNAATLYIAGAPTANDASAIITAPYALFVDTDEARFDGNSQFGIGRSGYVAPVAITTRAPSDVAGTSSDQIRLQSLRTSIVTGETLGGISWESVDTNISSADVQGGAVAVSIRALAEATHTASVLDTGLAFLTVSGDPTTGYAERMRLSASGKLGIGTTTPFADLSVHAGAGDTNRTLFAIGSSTASATTTLFSVSNTGSTTITGGLAASQLTVTGTATSTFANGINLAAGCISVNGQCLAPASNFGTTSIDTSSELAAILTDETGSGALVFGTAPTMSSTTLTGLTTLQNATTSSFAVTGTSYFGGNVGIGTTTPESPLTVLSTIPAGMVLYRNSAANSSVEYRNTLGSWYTGISQVGEYGVGPTNNLNSTAMLRISSTTGLFTLSNVMALNTPGAIRLGRADSGSRFHEIGTQVSVTPASNYMDFALHQGAPNGTSSVMRLTGEGFVGIGTTSPVATLSVLGDSWFQGKIGINSPVGDKQLKILPVNTAATHAGIDIERLDNAQNAIVEFYPQGANTSSNVSWNMGMLANRNSFSFSNWDGSQVTEIFTVANTNNVGIGTTSPSKKLSVDGTVNFTNLTTSVGAGTLCRTSSNEVVYNASDACLSSLRATKHDIETLDVSALDMINELEPVTFVYNDSDGRLRYGFIAEDTQAVDEHLVTYNGETLSGIDDRGMLAVIVDAIKEVYSTITEHSSRIETLEAQVQTLQAEIDGLQEEEPGNDGGGDNDPPAPPPEEPPSEDPPIDEEPPVEEPPASDPEPETPPEPAPEG